MKTPILKKLTQVLTGILFGVLVVTVPAFASDAKKCGGDDSSVRKCGDDDGSGGDKPSSRPGKVRGAFIPSITTTKVKGKFQDIVKKGGAREEMEIKFKVGKTGGPVTGDNFNTGAFTATFMNPDASKVSVCELDVDDTPSIKYFEYSLKLRERNGGYQEKDGFCETPLGTPATAIPEFSGIPIVILFDADGNPGTTGDITEIATGTF